MSLQNLFIKRFLNLPVYQGPYDVKRWRTPRKNKLHLQEAATYFERSSKEEPGEVSPFHVVFRVSKDFKKCMWPTKVKLRRLGLNQLEPGEPVVIPNTPHYNALLWDVKHLIHLKPIKFVNGFPTEKDIGATRLCPHTGIFEINEALRVSPDRLYGDEVSEFHQKHYLRNYLRKLSGIFPHCYA